MLARANGMLCTCPVKISCQSQKNAAHQYQCDPILQSQKIPNAKQCKYKDVQSASEPLVADRKAKPATNWMDSQAWSQQTVRPRLDVHKLHACPTIGCEKTHTEFNFFYLIILYVEFNKLQRTSVLFSRPTHVRHRTVACCMCIFSCRKWAIVFKVER